MTALATSSPARHSVRRATARDVPALARALAEAFEDDPVGRWFFPRDRTRLGRLERFFRLVCIERIALPHDEIHTTADTAGAALWMPPNSLETSTLDELRLLPAMLRVCGGDVVRALRGIAAMDAVHPHEPHWYLPQIGVANARRGQGVGSALLAPVLARCDAEGMPAYLEATTPRSRALYARHGFEVVGVLRLPDDGPPLWRMWREPRADGAREA